MKQFRKEWCPVKDAWQTYYWDESKQELTIKNTFEVGDILEQNKRRANSSLDQRYGNERLHEVAQIPVVFVTKFLKEYNLDVFSSDPSEKKRLRKLLEDPEFRFLKTTVKKLWTPTPVKKRLDGCSI